jgi:haloalkane dehalogenase
MKMETFPESKFVQVRGHRIHYVEQGAGDPILFVHGNPTSSYLWRNVLPAVASSTGRRGIALDLLGFGKSDKPAKLRYSLELHSGIIEEFIVRLGLENIVLVADAGAARSRPALPFGVRRRSAASH